MQFEPVYLNALMESHGEALEAAKMAYAGYGGAGAVNSPLNQILENLDSILESLLGD